MRSRAGVIALLIAVTGCERQPVGPRVDVSRQALVNPPWVNAPPQTPGSWGSGSTTTQLSDSRILVVGGWVPANNAGTPLTELFDPSVQSWSAGPTLLQGRYDHTSTLLNDGRVLVVGGMIPSTINFDEPTASTELFDSKSNTWSEGPALNQARFSHTATLLSDGRVVVIGGGADETPTPLGNTEIFDPVANTWTFGPSLTPRLVHFALRLANDDVMVGAGYAAGSPTSAVDRVDLDAGITTAMTPLAHVAGQASVARLASGSLLVVGTSDGELYDPSTGTSTEVGNSSSFANGYPSLMRLANGSVLASLLVGVRPWAVFDPSDSSWNGPSVTTPDVWALAPSRSGRVLALDDQLNTRFFDWETSQWATSQTLSQARQRHTATLLTDGRLMVCGGRAGGVPLVSCESFDPTAAAWSNRASLATARSDHRSSLLRDGRVLVTGGIGVQGALAVTEVYDAAHDAWSAGPSLGAARSGHSHATLNDGSLLVIGGFDGAGVPMSSVEHASADATAVAAAPSLHEARGFHRSVVLRDGRVLVAGGVGSLGPTVGVELFDPRAGTWTAAHPLNSARAEFALAMMDDGRVLAVGGTHGSSAAPAEVYDPATDSWTAIASPDAPRSQFELAHLFDQKFLTVGGHHDVVGAVALTETFDPLDGTWYPTAYLPQPTFSATATRLLDGTVLVAGGSDGGTELAAVARYTEGPIDTRLRPVLDAPVGLVAAGGVFTITGQQLRGVECAGEAATEGTAVFMLENIETGDSVAAPALRLTASSATLEVPRQLQTGWHAIRVVADGVSSTARLVYVSARCVGVTCSGGDACHTAACDPATGLCTLMASEGGLCDDSNPCTRQDTCDSSGSCAGTAYSCTASDVCSVPECDGDGGCTLVSQPDSTSCDDGDACTANDRCTAGACAGERIACPSSACHVGRCSPQGACVQDPVADGARCDGGTCSGGVCLAAAKHGGCHCVTVDGFSLVAVVLLAQTLRRRVRS